MYTQIFTFLLKIYTQTIKLLLPSFEMQVNYNIFILAPEDKSLMHPN